MLQAVDWQNPATAGSNIDLSLAVQPPPGPLLSAFSFNRIGDQLPHTSPVLQISVPDGACGFKISMIGYKHLKIKDLYVEASCYFMPALCCKYLRKIVGGGVISNLYERVQASEGFLRHPAALCQPCATNLCAKWCVGVWFEIFTKGSKHLKVFLEASSRLMSALYRIFPC